MCFTLVKLKFLFLSVPEGDHEISYLWEFFEKGFVSIANRHASVMNKQVHGVDNCPLLNSDMKSDMKKCDYFVMKAR